MKIMLNFLVLFVLSSFALLGQIYENGTLGKVTANSGLILRKSPSTSAEKITTIPLNTTVYYYMRYNGEKEIDKAENLNGNNGRWRQVYYNGYYGYAFDAYLEASVDYKIAEANIYGILSEKVPIYSEPYGWSDVVQQLTTGDELYVIELKKVPKNPDKSVFIKVRYKDKVGYIDSQEITPLQDFRMLMDDLYHNQSEYGD